MARLEDFVSLVQLTPGRAQYALTQSMAALAAEPDSPLKTALGAAQAAAGRLAEAEARWATRKAQSTARGNAAAGSVPELGAEFTTAVRELYDRRIRAAVHDRW